MSFYTEVWMYTKEKINNTAKFTQNNSRITKDHINAYPTLSLIVLKGNFIKQEI